MNIEGGKNSLKAGLMFEILRRQQNTTSTFKCVIKFSV